MLLPSASTEFLALFGGALHSSPSPQTHSQWAQDFGLNLLYLQLPCDSEADFIQLAGALMRCSQFKGGNITNPFKTAAFQLNNVEIDPSALVCGAGNTLYRQGQRWMLSNTDLAGCMSSIRTALTPNPPPFDVIILGTGAMSRTVSVAMERVCQELKTQPVRTRTVGRVELASHDFGHLHENDTQLRVVINTLPSATQAEADLRATRYLTALQSMDHATRAHVLFDLSYIETRTSAFARENGLTVETGRNLFQVQARESFKLWTQIDLPTDAAVQWPHPE